MNTDKVRIKYSVDDIDKIIDCLPKSVYDIGDMADIVAYCVPAYSKRELRFLFNLFMKVSKLVLMKYRKSIRFKPLCLIKAEKYYPESKRWSYDLIPTLTVADTKGIGYEIEEDDD